MDPQHPYAPQPQQGQQQTQFPQWQGQGQPGQYQQTMPGMQQGVPQQADMGFEGASSMAMPIPTQGTPQLNEMYSQGQMPSQQGGQPFAQQDFAQQPQIGFQNDHPPHAQQYQDMPVNPGMFDSQPLHQAPIDPSLYSNPPGAAQQQQTFIPQPATSQHPIPNIQRHPGPQQPTIHQPSPQAPSQTAFQDNAGAGSQFNYDPNTTAWEAQNVTSVPDFAQQATQHPPQQQPQDPSSRAAALLHARNRISALELSREAHDTQRALALSEQESSFNLQEREEEQLHRALLESLDSYERDLRRYMEMAGGGGGDPEAAAAYQAAPASQYGGGRSDARFRNPSAGGFSSVGMGMGMRMENPTSPTPTPQPHPYQNPPTAGSNSLPSGVQYYQTGNGSGGQTPTIHHPAGTSSPPSSSAWQAQSQQQQQGPEIRGLYTPRSYTPTPGTAASHAAGNLGAEEARRWEAFERARRNGGGSGFSEAGGSSRWGASSSKGKGRAG